MDWRSAIRIFISYFIIIVLFFPVDQQASFSSPGNTLSLGQRKVDANHAVLHRDTRSPTSGSVSNAASLKVCSKFTDIVKFDLFNSSCIMCAVSVDFRAEACPLRSQPDREAVRGCIFESAGLRSVFSFEGCNFECVDTESDNPARECCQGYWGPLCSECPGGSSYPCSSRGRCDEGRDGTGICSCDDGYTGTACEICSGDSCPEKQACRYNSDCHFDASCESLSQGSASPTCQCLNGYHGDGVECYPINPCLDNSHRCPTDTTLCIYDGPIQYHCECKPGYTEFQKGCFRDECLTNSTQRSCSTGAECATISPGQVVCQCGPGYVGNGLVCYGNVMERLEHHNGEGGDLDGRLTHALLLLEASLMHRWLRDRDVFYTVFLPLDEAPQFINSEFAAQLEAGLLAGSDDRADAFLETVAKLHIVPGYVDSPILQRIRGVYSLAGQKIIVGQDSTNLTVGLEGSAQSARVIHSDLPASNGVIHIIDRVLLPNAGVNQMVQGSMLDVLSTYSNLGTFTGMIKSSDILRSALDSEEVSRTLFAVTDDALLQVGLEFDSWLVSGLWEKFVRYFIYRHMAPIQLSSHGLMKAGEIQNNQEDYIEIRVSENGRINVAGFANITTPDIDATNGVIHIIDAMLISSSFFTFPETCIRNQSEGQIQECCEGFYTPLCIPCRSLCYGNGQCDDGMEGSGDCICEVAFNGEECLLCSDSTMYGPYCNQSCSCIHGVCSNGSFGTGHCRLDTCSPGYIGEDCHLQATPCGPQEDQCHAHSMCIIEEGVPRCVCNTQYTGSGQDCFPVNPCQQPDQGGCDPAVAECIYTGPGMHRCRCKEGYAGRGGACTPRDRCLEDNGGCHQDAICLHLFALDLIECICSFGLEGNGYACEPINACLRPHNCDPEAQCKTTGPGTYECVCPPGWRLDKRNCYSNLAVELSSLSEADPFWKLIQAVSLDGYMSHMDHSLGVIVPPPHMVQLINSTSGGALAIERILAYFVRSNMFMIDRSQRYLNQTLPSLQPGENVMIDGHYGNLSIINGHIAQVENATNGLIFCPISYPKNYWINRLLEVQGKRNLLTPYSGDVQDYSQAWRLMQASGLLPLDSATPYTVFLPDNVAMTTFNWSAENADDFLQHHLMIGKTLYYHNISEEQNVTTVSGQHLLFVASNEMASVDLIPIEAPDILILPNGVAHGIPGILSSSLREGRCDDGMNGGCHQSARCIQKTSTMLHCQCLDGYHGNGVECVAIDPCYHDNGGCHFRAACIPVGQGERRCSCNYGYEGDGIVCLGSILEELRSIPEASPFVEFLENLDSQSFLMRGDGQFTVFVPSSGAITSFLQQQGLPQEWREERYTYLLTQYVLYHVIAGSHMTMADLHNRTTLGTMNGQDLDVHVTINRGGNIILGANATFLSSDLNASNGIIHIVDTMLIPPKIYEWPNEQDMETGLDEYDPHPHPNFGRDMGALGSSHNITTFLQLLQLTPMFQEFFINAHPRPGHRGPPPHRPPPRRPLPQGMTGWPGSDGGGREGGRGRGGYREEPGGIPRDESSGINETFSGQQRLGGMHHGGGSGGYGGGGYGGGDGGRSSPQWQERPHRGSRLRLGDLHPTRKRSGASRDVYGIHGHGERRLHNRDFDTHNHYQKRSLDRPPGSKPPGERPPHWMRHGGRFDRDSTIFAPSDEAFERLPPGKLEELVGPGNRLMLQEFIAHHVLPEERYFADLWPVTEQYAVPSLQGSDLRISIMGQGQLFVNERSRVIGVGLEFEGGVLYPVSEVITLPKMDGRCDIIEICTRMSHCKKCGSIICPPNTQQVGAEQPGCRYHGGWYASKRGCQAECQFTEVTRACCQGYYGSNCRECPGGSTFPCNNHGSCSQGYHDDGVCSCHGGFTGTACERCLPGFYGPSCRKCRCSNSSICHGQSGECFCSIDRDGPFCDRILTVIPSCEPPCHQNAVCRHGNVCQCSPQYHGDGYTCNTINRCFSENGGCGVHATCTHNASAISVNCTCHDGYHGDGVVCLPVNLCEEDDNGGCHPNATCRFRGPNSRSCVCRLPYWGDGLQCHPPVTSCLTNNGRCSPNAHCQDGQDGGPIECTCFAGYVGDGILCNGNLYDTLASQPEFYYFFKMVTQLANQSRDGERLVKDLLKDHDPLTIFIPLNPELSGLTFYPSQVLLHVVHDRWSREDLLEEGEEDEDLETWSGHELSVHVKHDHHHQIVTIQDVPVVKFGMEATNGVIHIIEAPLPIWIMLDYDKEDDDEEDQENQSDMMRSAWNSASRIFAAVAVPLGLFAFIIVVVLYWFRGRKLRELTLQDQSQGATTAAAVVQGTDAGRPSMPLTAPQTPPVSPVSSVDQGDIQYSEFDRLMSAETGEKVETHLETRC